MRLMMCLTKTIQKTMEHVLRQRSADYKTFANNVFNYNSSSGLKMCTITQYAIHNDSYNIIMMTTIIIYNNIKKN